MSYGDFLKEMKADPQYASAFEGSGGSGGGLPGAPVPAATGGTYTEKQIADMPQAEYARLRSEGKIT